ncbi:MAG TPA: glycosyltransferase [Candidatus Sulfotelmatobacter sp.]|nr:glycosyltransferase [Candidatus Sulfotelmatobacter sp.]
MTLSVSPTSRSHQTTAETSAKVLVGIVTRNRHEVLPKAIESALRQRYPRLEVAVLDDGSEDDTPQLQFLYPAVRWVHWERSRGLLEARNCLMRESDADFFVSLDDDAWFVDGDEISIAVRHMETHPHVAAAAFDILSPDREKTNLRSQPRPTHMFIGCGHILRISAVRECGFYVPGPGQYGSEELDLCIRLLDRNREIHFLPGVHVWHDKTNVARDIPAQHRSGVCNDLAFAVRRCPFPLVLGIIPVKLINHLRFSAGNRLLNSCLAGLRLFFSRAGAIWKSREPVRTVTFLNFLRRVHHTR